MGRGVRVEEEVLLGDELEDVVVVVEVVEHRTPARSDLLELVLLLLTPQLALLHQRQRLRVQHHN